MHSLIPIAAGAILLISGYAAQANGNNCGDRGKIVAQLEGKYGEARTAVGLNGDDSVTEVFSSAETGTWTILRSLPSGVSCLIAAGSNWAETTDELRPAGVKI